MPSRQKFQIENATQDVVYAVMVEAGRGSGGALKATLHPLTLSRVETCTPAEAIVSTTIVLFRGGDNEAQCVYTVPTIDPRARYVIVPNPDGMLRVLGPKM